MIEWQTLTLAGFGALYVLTGFAVTMMDAKKSKRRGTAKSEIQSSTAGIVAEAHA